MAENEIPGWIARMKAFQDEAGLILGSFESSSSRSFTLDVSYRSLDDLTVKQDELFRQALRCVENQLYRAAHVMAWAGLVDCLHHLVLSDSFLALNEARENWKIVSVEDLSERFTEYALIEALLVMKVIHKTESKAFLGMLSKRNECAHAGDYFPTFNETLGYISEIMSRLKRIQTRYPKLQL